MKQRSKVIPLLILAVAMGACESPESSVPGNVVARAAGVDLTAETAGELLASQTQLPNQSVVVDALANLWSDYFLLARVIADDTTLANLDVSPLVRQNVEQEMVYKLREQVVQVDTSFTEDELRERYERELPGTRIRARHILFRIPTGASPAQEDSVRALAESVRQRILDGENFAVLAGEYSQDPGTASKGGDLGFFTRGQMVPQFEDVAFNLDIGEVSPVVQTTFGFHIIRLDERIIPPFEENKDRFRQQLTNRILAEAESTYVAGVMDKAQVEILPDGFETARQLADDPTTPLTSRAENRTLIKFKDGKITVADFRDWVTFRPLGVRDEIRKADDDRLNGLMQNLARERLLVREAREAGLEVPQARQDSLANTIRDGVKTVARQLGFFQMVDGIQGTSKEARDEAVNQAVIGFLHNVVEDRRDVVPLGGISMALRSQFHARVYSTGVQKALDVIAALRAQGTTNPPAQSPPDTAGSPDLDAGSSGEG